MIRRRSLITGAAAMAAMAAFDADRAEAWLRHGVVPPPAPPAPAFTYNYAPTSQMTRFRNAGKAMLAGTGGRVKVGVSGESCPTGFGANNGGNNYRNFSYFAYLAKAYGSLGTYDNYMGGSPDTDGRLAYVGGGQAAPGVTSWGGGCMLGTSAIGDGCMLTWGSGIPYNTVRLISVWNGTQFDVSTGSGSPTGSPSPTTNTGNFQEYIFTVSMTTDPTTIKQVNAGNGFVMSCEVYDTTRPRFNFMCGSIGGQATASYNTVATGFTYPAGMIAADCDLMFTDVGINDGNTYNTDPDTYFSQLNTSLNYLDAKNTSVILTSPHPIAGGNMETGPTYWQGYQNKLIGSGRCVISQHDRTGTWQSLQDKGWNYDGLHYNELYGQDYAYNYLKPFLDGVIAA